MQVHEIAMSLTGMSFPALFGGANPPVAFGDDGEGTVIKRWDSTRLGGVAQPSAAQLLQLLAAPPSASVLAAYANAKQWALAIGGYTYTPAGGGTPIAFSTTPDSLTLIAGKDARLAKPNPPATINWQLDTGAWVTIAAADFDAAAVLIDDFVQATFDALKVVEAAIAGGTITTTAQVDGAAAWPANHN